MAPTRPFALVRTRDQWLRSAHEDTYLDPISDALELDWTAPAHSDTENPAPLLGAGLAFDQECRLYHSLPDQGGVERVMWAARQSAGEVPAPMELFPAPEPEDLGEFAPANPAPTALAVPRGLAVDVDDRLFVAESGANRILVFELWSRRLLRKVVLGDPLAPGPRPLDLAASGNTVHAVLTAPAGLIRLTARRDPVSIPLPAGVTAPSRIAVSPAGELFLLDGAAGAGARVVPVAHPEDAFAVPYATDVECEADGVVVVARRPGADFRRFRVAPGAVEELPPYKARGYDGLGIVRTPGDKPAIGFWTAQGFRHAVPARVTYARRGRVTTFRLDSGEFQTVWGRLFLDACIPEGTELRAHFITQDEPTDEPSLPWTLPEKLIKEVVPRPDLSPPLPPLSLVPTVEKVDQLLHRRESGRELPWAQQPPEDHFVTYEAPIRAPAGRYLWVTLELSGNTRQTPRVRGLRAEYPSHDYLRRLPKTFSRDPEAADFLRRYLAPLEGFLGDLEARAATRHALLNPRATPDELLPWLASFVGLVLDERWSAEVRRALIGEVIWLFRYRGTLKGLERFIELCLGVKPILIEHFRLRGLGGAVLGDSGPAFSSSVLGGGFRVGGQVGEQTQSPIQGTAADAFKTHAHRFSVLVPAALSTEQREMLEHLLEVHRPAHTIFDICTVDAGMRVGRGLHLGLSSIVGRTGGFSPLQVGGNAVLGRDAIVGRPSDGLLLDGSRLGANTRVR
ncbi:phage tail protein [Hyalangium gracile]|uniref:phage tail protein n=1 Tax=Hyalangium gracile TaxID=394092 RepID=UPI001CC96C27|nr:phage tail protein [Hyalangium gracile]